MTDECTLCGASAKYLECLEMQGDVEFIFCSCCGRVARVSTTRAEVH